MSAVNIGILHDRVLMLTDTKGLLGDIQYQTNKVATLPHSRLAIAIRGHTAALRVFERTLAIHAPLYDQAVTFIAERFRQIVDGIYEDQAEAFAMREDIDLFVAGWSRTGPAAFWVSSYQNGGAISRVTSVVTFPAISAAAASSFRSISDLPYLMRAQAHEHVGVGGTIIVTEIAENGIHQYPAGALDDFATMASSYQPMEDKAALAAIVAANADRAAKIAEMTETDQAH